jgi:hypothetical protein
LAGALYLIKCGASQCLPGVLSYMLKPYDMIKQIDKYSGRGCRIPVPRTSKSLFDKNPWAGFAVL